MKILAVATTLLCLTAPSVAPVSPASGGTALGVSGAPTRATADAPAKAATGKLEPRLHEQLSARDRGDLWVVLRSEPDLSKARRVSDRTDRGRRVVDELRATADTSQKEVRKFLRERKIRHQSFWVTNAVYVRDATLTDAEKLARLPGVEQLREVRSYAPPEPVEQKKTSAVPQGLEWGLTNINADDVWSQFDTRGEDIVVANIDTGVQFDHPALVGSYRGNNHDGTFDHDYNWLDTSGTCDGAPCDENPYSHGTHTMGTMVGDDGQGNQIGVAPGVTWITANGCATCSEADLVEAAQWMLAPTDGQGQNPDVSKRPHIVNNSWGSRFPTNDPLMEDVLEAWEASGILGIWSNGNNGDQCSTSGSPGSRILNYSVGSYRRDNRISDFSSRGPGQDGEIKPNITAPGESIRSALTGNRYGLMSGTSMAAPHVSGAVALLWSAHPELARDIESTRLLLDMTAIDTADDQCGGNAEDNNVYGEGRLDALALVQAGALGIGTVAGTVTDAETGAPISEATVTVSGPTDVEITTDADGSLDRRLLAGEYAVRVDAFGYEPEAATVEVVKGERVDLDVALRPRARVNVGGTVRDGSGTGWPLYAKVTATDSAGHSWSTHTDPATGEYRLGLLPGATYTVRSTVVYPGYQSAERQVELGPEPATVNVEHPASPACTAPGYVSTYSGAPEGFDRGLPKGWRVVDVDPGYPGYDHRPGWVFDDPGDRGNRTGGSGRFAIVDSDHYGQRHVQDTSLVGPAYDLSSATNPVIEFATHLEPAVNSTASVDVSVDGGRTWTTIWRKAGFPGVTGPEVQVVPVPEELRTAETRVRLRYTGQWSGWWAIDDLYVGDKTCEPRAGGRLVVGEVTAAGSGDGIVGATVTAAADPEARGTTVATPDDPVVADGFFWLATGLTGEQEFTATAEGYLDQSRTVRLEPDAVTEIGFALSRS